MKTFKEFVQEEMVSAVPANAVGTGAAVAGLTGDPPVGKRRKPVMTKTPLKRNNPVKM